MDSDETPELEKVSAIFLAAKEEWAVLRFEIAENMGCPYSGHVDIVTELEDYDFTKFLG
jgi:hypothetical protein